MNTEEEKIKGAARAGGKQVRNPHVKKIIDEEAEKIKARIKGGSLYGEPIRTTQNYLIVAAYQLGKYDQAYEAKLFSWPFPSSTHRSTC